jgi:hypothetical protein
MKDFADLKSLGKQLKEQAETRAAAEKERVKQGKSRRWKPISSRPRWAA